MLCTSAYKFENEQHEVLCFNIKNVFQRQGQLGTGVLRRDNYE